MGDRGGKNHWAGREEAGSYAGLRFFIGVYRLCGRTVFNVFLAPVMLYFFLRRGAERRASLAYLRRLHRHQPKLFPRPPGARHAFRHFRVFGESLLDKAIAWSDAIGPEQIQRTDARTYERIMQDTRGRLMIGSHFGNLELCRGFAARHRALRIHVLMHEAYARHFTRLMQTEAGASRTRVIPVSDLDLDTILRLKACVERGDWLVITGDRVPEWSRHRRVMVDFLGAPASVPIGPYVLAATLQCPVDLIFAYRDGDGVALSFEHFEERVVLPRGEREERIQSLAQRYADRLAHYCTLAPYQWFNFFDFWNSDDHVHANPTGPVKASAP